MFVLARALTYATLFIGLVLVFVPSRVLSWSGVDPPTEFGIWQGAAMIVGTAGAAVALSCILTFALVGKGTPAAVGSASSAGGTGPLPSGPQSDVSRRRLSPWRGAALFYQSLALAGYTGLFLLTMHVFVVTYEEPTLRQTFGDDYEAYCGEVNRWWPRQTSTGSTKPTCSTDQPNQPAVVSPSRSRPSRDRHR